MKKLVINKESLGNYKSLLIVLENCESYEIDIKDILDVECEAELVGKEGKTYRTENGFIKISAQASKTKENFALKEGKVNNELYYQLKERLQMCSGVDMVLFSLKGKEGYDVDIYVPYDPLESVVHGGEIELSNCPSLENDEEGNMIIAFGESSKQFKRKDNDYVELVEGWKEAFGEYQPEILKCSLERLCIFGENKNNLSLSLKIRDKRCNKKCVELIFIGCRDLDIDTCLLQKVWELAMSRMADGNIYVGLDGMGIDFVCDSVLEYDYYCNKKS